MSVVIFFDTETEEFEVGVTITIETDRLSLELGVRHGDFCDPSIGHYVSGKFEMDLSEEVRLGIDPRHLVNSSSISLCHMVVKLTE